MKYQLFFLLACFLFLNHGYTQIPTTPEKPKFQTSVYDDAGLLTSEQKLSLEQKLIQYADSTSTQIVVATILTTGGEEIGYYATNFAHKWGIGQSDKDNGVLILVAKDDRKMTIRTGYGVEHLLTDALSRRIIENIMSPSFKQGDYYKGLDEATNVIIEILSGTYKNDNKEAKSNVIGFLVIFIVFIIILIIISKNSKGNKGRGIFDGGMMGPIILSRGGRSTWGGGFGESSGGGFGNGGFGGGFGGGGFGGGGASGGW